MEKGSPGTRPDLDRLRTQLGSGRLTADEIATGERKFPEGQRQAGLKPGTYVVKCDWCYGYGWTRFNSRADMFRGSAERCMKCDGTGVLIVHERKVERIARAKAGLAYIALICFAVAMICLALLWRAL